MFSFGLFNLKAKQKIHPLSAHFTSSNPRHAWSHDTNGRHFRNDSSFVPWWSRSSLASGWSCNPSARSSSSCLNVKKGDTGEGRQWKKAGKQQAATSGIRCRSNNFGVTNNIYIYMYICICIEEKRNTHLTDTHWQIGLMSCSPNRNRHLVGDVFLKKSLWLYIMWYNCITCVDINRPRFWSLFIFCWPWECRCG